MTGLVYKSTGSWYTVKTLNGKVYECRIKGRFRLEGIKSTNPIAVGDFVDFELETKNNQESGVIHRIQNRKNYIVRKSVNLSKQTHIIASNIDQVFLLITLNNPPQKWVSTISEYSPVPMWNPIQSVMFSSSLLPVYTNNSSPPSVFNSNTYDQTFISNGQNSNKDNSISDIQVGLVSGSEYKPNILYVPSSQYRLISTFKDSIKIHEKGLLNDNLLSHIGLVGIYDYLDFWKSFLRS